MADEGFILSESALERVSNAVDYVERIAPALDKNKPPLRALAGVPVVQAVRTDGASTDTDTDGTLYSGFVTVGGDGTAYADGDGCWVQAVNPATVLNAQRWIARLKGIHTDGKAIYCPDGTGTDGGVCLPVLQDVNCVAGSLVKTVKYITVLSVSDQPCGAIGPPLPGPIGGGPPAPGPGPIPGPAPLPTPSPVVPPPGQTCLEYAQQTCAAGYGADSPYYAQCVVNLFNQCNHRAGTAVVGIATGGGGRIGPAIGAPLGGGPSTTVFPNQIPGLDGITSGSVIYAISSDEFATLKPADGETLVWAGGVPTAASASGSGTFTQGTLGTAVLTYQSTATNDDPKTIIYQDRVTTTNNTQTTLHAITLADDTMYRIEAMVIARRTGGTGGSAGDSAMYQIIGAYKRTGGGTAQAIGLSSNPLTTFNVADSTAIGFGAIFDTSGNDVRVRVTGDTNNNYTWHLAELKVSPLST